MVDYKAKYEFLVRNVLKDLESKVLVAQERAEKNAEASAAYCNELKRRLQEKQASCDELQRKLQESQKETEESRKEVEESRKEVQEKRKEAEERWREVEESRKKIEESRKEVEESQKQLKKLEQQHSQTQSDLQEAIDRLKLYGDKSDPGKDSAQPTAAESLCTSGESLVTGSGLVDFFSGLTALTVTQCPQPSGGVVYSCQVTDGALSGHSFTLTLDPSLNEFTYKPIEKSPLIPTTSVLGTAAGFPDYMLSRFLLNLLNATFKQTDS